MQASVQYVLETELEWLFYQLWSKNTARAPTFSFTIADTVVLRQGVPQTWYFSSKEGYIFKKNHSNVRIGKITRTFNKSNGMSGATNSNCLAAATTYAYRPQRNALSGEERLCLRIGYLSGNDLAAFLRSCAANKVDEGRPNVVQCFVAPKTIKNAVIRIKWTPHNMQLDKLANKLTVFDEKHSLAARLQTFEDGEASLMTEASSLPTQGYVFERLFKAIWEIHSHIKKNSDINIQAGNFFFKFNHSDEPVLLFATQLKTERPIVVLNSSVHMVIASQVHQQLALSPLREDFLETDEKLRSRTFSLHKGQSNLPSRDGPLISSGHTSSQDAKKREEKAANALTQQAATVFHPPAASSSLTAFKEEADSISSSGVKMYSVQKLQGTLPPLPAQKTTSKQNPAIAASNQCPFCLEKIDKAAARYELTVNQIVQMYEFYERSPAGLLMLPASSVKQQRFFEDVYAQVALKICANDSKDKLVSSTTSAKLKRQAQIPRPLQNALNLASFSRYQIDKNDPTFLFKAVKICSECYACVKAMITYQSNEQIRMASHVKSEYGASETGESLPKQAPMQDWRGGSEDGRGSEILKGEDSMTVESVCTSARVDNEVIKKTGEVASMFSKVQAGKEVQSHKDLSKNTSSVNMKTGRSFGPKQKPKAGPRVRSACGQRRRSGSAQREEESERARLVEQHSKDIEGDLKSMNKQIIKFVQRNAIPNSLEDISARKQLKPPTRPKPEVVKAHLNKVVSKPNFLGKNFLEKKQLRDARRSIRRQQAQATMDSQKLLDRHRIVANSHNAGKPSDHLAQLAPLQLQSLLFPMPAYPHQISAKQARPPTQRFAQQHAQGHKGRPISAKQPVLQKAFRIEGEDLLAQQQYSLQPHEVYSQDSFGRMARQASANEIAGLAGHPTNSQVDLTLTDNPHVYSKYDMARVYLNPIYKSGELARQTRLLKQTPKMASSYIVTQLNKSSYPCVRLNSAKPRPYGNPQAIQGRQPAQSVMPAALQVQHSATYGARQSHYSIEGDFESRNPRLSFEGEVQRASLDMFNYQSNVSTQLAAGQQATVQVHQFPQANHASSESQSNLEQRRHEKSLLAASLLGLHEIGEDEIDEIAANADNLIKILKDIKQRKGLSSQLSDQAELAACQQKPGKDLSQQCSNDDDAQLESQLNTMPPQIHAQDAAEEPGAKVEDFWNTQRDWQREECSNSEQQLNQNADLWDDYDEEPPQLAWQAHQTAEDHSPRSSPSDQVEGQREQSRDQPNDQSVESERREQVEDAESIPQSSEKIPCSLPHPGDFGNFHRVSSLRQERSSSQAATENRARTDHGSMDFSLRPADQQPIEVLVSGKPATSRRSGHSLPDHESQRNPRLQASIARESQTQRASQDGTSQDTGAHTQQTKQCDMERSFKERKERIDDLPQIKQALRSERIEERIPEEEGCVEIVTPADGLVGSADSIPEDLMGRIDELVKQRVAEQLNRQQPQMPSMMVFAAGQDDLVASKVESSIQDEYLSDAFHTKGRGEDISESIQISQGSQKTPAASQFDLQPNTPGFSESRIPSEIQVSAPQGQKIVPESVQPFVDDCRDSQLERSKTLQASGLEQNIQEQTDRSGKPFEETAQFNPNQSKEAEFSSEGDTRPVKSQDFAEQVIQHPRDDIQTQDDGAATQAMQSIEASILQLGHQSSAKGSEFEDVRGRIQKSEEVIKSEKLAEHSQSVGTSHSELSADLLIPCMANLHETKAIEQAKEAQSVPGSENQQPQPSTEKKPDFLKIVPPDSIDGEDPKAKSFVNEPCLNNSESEQKQPSMDTMSGIASPSEPIALKKPTSTAFNNWSQHQQEPLSEQPESFIYQEKTQWKISQPSLDGSVEEIKVSPEAQGVAEASQGTQEAEEKPQNQWSKCSTQVIKATSNELKRRAGQSVCPGGNAPSAQAERAQASGSTSKHLSQFSAEFLSSRGFRIQPEEALSQAMQQQVSEPRKRELIQVKTSAANEVHAVQLVLENSDQYSEDTFSAEDGKSFKDLSEGKQGMGMQTNREETNTGQKICLGVKDRYADASAEEHVESDYFL